MTTDDIRRINSYLKSVEKRLQHAHEILCSTPDRLKGKGLLYISDEEFCVDPVEQMMTIMLSSFAGCLIVITMLILTAYRLRLKIHSTWDIRPFES